MPRFTRVVPISGVSLLCSCLVLLMEQTLAPAGAPAGSAAAP
jgi:hypothetical protein